MLYAREGYPEEDEIVLCKVTAVRHNSVFANLEEYKGKSGMIHISEVSPGRIRNIRDYVTEGKKVVCKVLRIDKEKGHIDLSLRRVNESQKKTKVSQLKQEQKAEKILEFVAKELDLDLKKTYDKIMKKLEGKHERLYPYFFAIVMGEEELKNLKLDKKLEKNLDEVIKDRIKKPEVEIKGKFKFTTFESNGVELVKKALKEAKKAAEDVEIIYSGAGEFSVTLKAKDYKVAEKELKKAKEAAIKVMEDKGTANFERVEV